MFMCLYTFNAVHTVTILPRIYTERETGISMTQRHTKTYISILFTELNFWRKVMNASDKFYTHMYALYTHTQHHSACPMPVVN